MKKQLILCILWDFFFYLIIYLIYTCVNPLVTMASRTFDVQYTWYGFMITILFQVLLGISYLWLLSIRKTSSIILVIAEFLIIAGNALFLCLIGTSMIFPSIPPWLFASIKNMQAIASFLIGIELSLLIKSIVQHRSHNLSTK